MLGEFSPGSDIYYLLGLDLIGQQQGDNWSYFGYDGLGSVRQMYDPLGVLNYSASYDPYGIPFEQFGLGSSFGFTGEYTDPNGLIYLRARYMSPLLGTFLSRDPVMGMMGGQSIRWNPYIYAGANPVNYTDPSGKFFPAGFLGGAVMGAAFDFFSQLILEGKPLHCIDMGSVLLSGLIGGIGGMVGHFSKGFNLLKRLAMDIGADVLASTAADVVFRGADFGAAFGPNLIAGALGSALGGAIEKVAGKALKALANSEFAEGFMRGVGKAGDFISSGLRGIGRSIGDTTIGSGLGRAWRGMKNMADNAISRLRGGVDDACPVFNSFSEDTKVATADGDVPISDIAIGDEVLAYNESTGETGEYTVTDTISHVDEVIIHLTIDDELIETTAEHLFYTSEGEWVNAGELEPGDQIWSLDGDYGTVESVAVIEDVDQRMYNLTVDQAHTFFVGDGEWLVHNQGVCNVPEYAVGNGGDTTAARKHSLATLELYDPSKTTVFPGVFDIQTKKWIAFPGQGTVLKTGQIPPIGFHVGWEGGHLTIWQTWRALDSTVFQGGRFGRINPGSNRNIGFTLFYHKENAFGIRWTSRSINQPNWGIDSVLPVWVPERPQDLVIKLWEPVLDGVEAVTGIRPEYLPMNMMPEKPGR